MGVFCFSILSGMKAVFLFFCMVIAVALAQQAGFQDTLIIDDFTTVTPQIIVQTEANSQYPIVQTRSTTASDILGGERDLRLTVLSGSDNLVLSSGVSNGLFQCATPAGARGRSTLQFDGVDGSINLNPSGLGGLNFRNNGGNSFRVSVTSDLATRVDFLVYSGSTSAVCVYNLTLVAGSTVDTVILFSQFSSGCDFSSVGAIEIVAQMEPNVDVQVSLFSVYGPIPVTPTPSRTPTPVPSNSVTPSRTPTPSNRCVCNCNAFTCDIRVDPLHRFDTFSYYRTSDFDDIDTITVPSVTIPTVTVPTFTVPTVTVPTVTVPTITIPTVTVPTITYATGGSSDAGVLALSLAAMMAVVFAF